MTRHGIFQPHAAGAQPATADTRVSMVMIVVDMTTISPVPGRLHYVQVQRSGPSACIPATPRSGCVIADISQKPKSP